MLNNIADISELTKNCYGCRACEQACKSNAIQVGLDKEGFLYPQIDKDKCVECRLCINVCPVLVHPEQEHKEPLKIVAAWSKDNESRELATSGGIFFEIAEKIIQRGGVVFGAAYDKDWNLEHSEGKTLDECMKFRGSKYAQSDTKETFSQVGQHLKNGRLVYYTGTPCQIAGLKNYLKSESPTLLTSDIICHGTPSNQLFKQEIMWREAQRGKKIQSMTYRDKDRFGWGYDCKIVWDDGIVDYADSCDSPFFNGFWENKILRPSCYNCSFASLPRLGDITLADFWGVKKYVKGIRHTGRGVSMVFANSTKGVQLLNDLDNVAHRESDLQAAMNIQAHLSRSVKRPLARKGIYDSAYTEDYGRFAEQNLESNGKVKLRRDIKNLVKRFILWKHWK